MPEAESDINPFQATCTDERRRSTPSLGDENSRGKLVLAAVAAFCTYFCMYAFRKPFTAGTFEGQEVFGLGLKTVLVISQLAGYMLSKFIGVKIVSEMPRQRRAIVIIGLILVAEGALVGFALAPLPLKAPMLFINGLPLGMIFGLVLSFLEGRKQTEALTAVLCASFIISSGVVKSVGRWMVQDLGVSEFLMPMLVGLIFLPALFASVWLLQSTPPPDQYDRRLRNERRVMRRSDRTRFWRAYWPGLSALVFVYVALTIVRTIRDDFAVEIWRDMGIDQSPSIFARSEMVVAVLVTALNALAIWIRHNLIAIRATIYLMCGAFCLAGGSALVQALNLTSPFAFMVACGVGMYIPYVAFHTTIFERLVAASRHPGNLVFLMYVADSVGYLGYALVLIFRTSFPTPVEVLPLFLGILLFVSFVSIAALLIALHYFHRVLSSEVVVRFEPDVADLATVADTQASIRKE